MFTVPSSSTLAIFLLSNQLRSLTANQESVYNPSLSSLSPCAAGRYSEQLTEGNIVTDVN